MKRKKIVPKTKVEVAAEVKTLKKMLPRIRQFSSFGDDNHMSLRAQIRVLEEDSDEQDIYDRYDDNPDLCSNALEARRWMDGEADESLVDSWKSLVR